MPPRPAREVTIERRLARHAAALNGAAPKLAAMGQAGFPDRTLLLPGGVVAFAEVKRPGGRPTPLQAAWLRRLDALGFAAGVYDGTLTPEEWLAERAAAIGWHYPDAL